MHKVQVGDTRNGVGYGELLLMLSCPVCEGSLVPGKANLSISDNGGACLELDYSCHHCGCKIKHGFDIIGTERKLKRRTPNENF